MKEFQQRRKVRRLLYSKASLLLLLILLVFVGKGTWGVFGKERESRRQLELAEAELAALEARAAVLRERIERLRTPEGIEAEIREQFQVAKPGERMVVIVEKEKAEGEEPSPKQSLVSKFFDLFR